MPHSRELMMKTILFATDFSDASMGALHYATQLARCFSSKVLLVHVVDPARSASAARQATPSLSELISSAEDELERISMALDSDGVHCAMIVRAGGIRETIMALIGEREVDLVVIGTRGIAHKNQDRFGSVAEVLLRAAPCPVLTVGDFVRQDAFDNTHCRTILFPTDFSEKPDAAALEYAELLTRHLSGRLLLLHVDENYANVQHPKREEDFRELLRKGCHSTNTECMVRVGRPADIIVTVSKDKWVDFIVMGIHGTDQADSARNYGTSCEVIRLARCPVITLHINEKTVTPISSDRLNREAKDEIVDFR
jgi:nucleotide-binding universal stress UspA family protein